MTVPHEGAAFLDAVCAAPDDDTPRLMFADWLTERDDPRGEFIRVQCLLEQMAVDEERRAALELRAVRLLEAHQEEWLRGLRALGVTSVRFRRGFVEAVTMRTERFLPRAAVLFATAPIQTVCLQFPRARDIAALAVSPHLARIRGLALVDCPLRSADVRLLVNSPHAAQLTGLELGVQARIGYEGVRELASSPMLANLRYLRLHEVCRGRDLVDSLVVAPWLQNLTNLHLIGHQLTAEEVLTLLGPSALSSLRTLSLWNNSLGDDGLEQLLQTSALTRLRKLNLNTNNLSRRGAESLAAWPHLGGLEVLHVAFNTIGHEGIWALIDSPHRAANCNLNFGSCGNTPERERKRIRDRIGLQALDRVEDWALDRLQPA